MSSRAGISNEGRAAPGIEIGELEWAGMAGLATQHLAEQWTATAGGQQLWPAGEAHGTAEAGTIAKHCAAQSRTLRKMTQQDFIVEAMVWVRLTSSASSTLRLAS